MQHMHKKALCTYIFLRMYIDPQWQSRHPLCSCSGYWPATIHTTHWTC